LKVTIGIPTYNQAVYIEKAVESALAQTYPFIEVIVADDCSTDNTAALLQKYGTYPGFTYVKNAHNLGRVNNYRNLLYNLASGEWYINADGDDYLKDVNFISNAVEAIQTNSNVVAVTANCERLDEAKKKSVIYTSHYSDKQVIDGLQYLKDIAAQKAQLNHLTTLYNRHKAMEIDFYRLNILSSDFESIYRLLLHGRVIYLNNTAAVWRNHGRNTVLTKNDTAAVKNLILPGSVAAYAAQIKIDMNAWKNSLQKNMIAAILLESKKQSYTRLMRSFIRCFFAYPLVTLKILLNLKAVLKHI